MEPCKCGAKGKKVQHNTGASMVFSIRFAQVVLKKMNDLYITKYIILYYTVILL